MLQNILNFDPQFFGYCGHFTKLSGHFKLTRFDSTTPFHLCHCPDLFSPGPKPVTAGGPPPPPPPPPPGLFDDVKAEAKSETKAINALFADINRGDDVTKGQLLCRLG
jgi:hypothetical protein